MQDQNGAHVKKGKLTKFTRQIGEPRGSKRARDLAPTLERVSQGQKK